MKTGRNLAIMTIVFLMVAVLLSWSWIVGLRKDSSAYKAEIESLKKKSETYGKYINSTSIAHRSYLGRTFPKFSAVDVIGREVDTDFSRRQGGLVLLFSNRSCQPCLNSQFKMFKNVYENLAFQEDFGIVAISDIPSTHLRKYTRLFDGIPYPLVSDTSKVFFDRNPLLSRGTPVVFFIDQNNTIVRSHLPYPNSPQFSALFFNSIQHRLRLSEPLFDNHLKGLRFTDVILRQFDEEPIKEFLY